MRGLLLGLSLALCAPAPAQTLTPYNLIVDGSTICAIEWNGRPALLITNREGACCTFSHPRYAVRSVRLDIVAVGVVDMRPCAAGIGLLNLSYRTYHHNAFGPVAISPAGFYLGTYWPRSSVPYEIMHEGRANDWQDQRYWWSYCGDVQCSVNYQQCGTQPQWNAIVAYPVLL